MYFFEKNIVFQDFILAKDDKGNRVSYQEYWDYASAIAIKIKKRSLVFCFCRNTVGSLIGYASFLNNSVVPLMLNSKIDYQLVRNLIEAYRPEYVYLPEDISEEDFPEDISPIIKIRDYILYSTSFLTKNSDILYENLAILITTSGSTGTPKFVRQSYRNIQSNAEAIVEYLKLNEKEKPITTLPMNYTYGLSIINSHMQVGATILVTQYDFMQKEFWNFLESEQATSFGGVPYTYEILDKLKFIRHNPASIKTMTQAGGKLSKELHNKFAKYACENDKKFVVMYGQTEATARMSYLPMDMSIEKCGSIGIAIPGGRFELVDDENQAIQEVGVSGELLYYGDNVTLGYAENREDLSLGDEHKGVLYTGDIAQKDKDGYFYIVGRKKRFLKVYGNRINLDELDLLVKKHFSGLDCASSGRDDLIEMYITEKEQTELVKKWIVELTGLSHLGVAVYYIPEIPKNETGKVMYNLLFDYGK